MSSRELEEMQEQKFNAWLSSQTGFNTEELDGHSLAAIDGNDGALYGYDVTLVDGRSVRIGIPPEEPDYDD